MKINLSDLNPGTFFVWPGEPEDSKNGVTVRALTSAEAKRINAATLKSRRTRFSKKGIQYEETVYNEAKKEEMYADYSIVEWTGVDGDDDKPLKCTSENKAKIMNEHPQLMTFIMDCIDSISELQETKDKESEKN